MFACAFQLKLVQRIWVQLILRCSGSSELSWEN